MNKPQAGNEFNRVKKSKPNERREKVEAESEKSFPTSFVKSDLYKQGLVLFLNTVWRLCKCDLKVSTHTLRPDT